mgnify:CR=1 FL=1
MKVRITAGPVTVEAELADTACGRAIAEQLPLSARPNVWGDEFYFTVAVDMPLDDTATASVRVGDIGYWPPGNALAIFFGPTPLSAGPEPVPASEVNIVGRIIGNATELRKAKGTREITLLPLG